MDTNSRLNVELISENPKPLVPTKPSTKILKEVGKRCVLGEIKNQQLPKQELGAIKTPIVFADSQSEGEFAGKLSFPEEKENEVSEDEDFEKLDEVSLSERYIKIEEKMFSSCKKYVPEYAKKIYEYLYSIEKKFDVNPTFLSCSKTTHQMRSVLVNWLVETHVTLKMHPETLHLCISTIDRYLQVDKSIEKSNLQLVGITSLWIASKYEEVHFHGVMTMVHICDGTFSAAEIKNMELVILKALNFSFGKPTSLSFLRCNSRIAGATALQHNCAKYLLELALLDYSLCCIRPSLQAAAALYVSMIIFSNKINNNVWTDVLVHFTSYKLTEIKNTVKLFAQAIIRTNTTKFTAIKKKYSAPFLGKVSTCSELRGPIIWKLADNGF